MCILSWTQWSLHLRSNAIVKKIILALVFLLPFSAGAELILGMRMEHKQVLQFEPVHFYLTLFNDTNHPFVINSDRRDNKSSIEFNITRGGKEIKRLHPDRLIVENLSVMPDEKRDIMINIAKWYDLSEMGKHIISVVVKDGKSKYIGKKFVVDVVYGAKLDSLVRAADGFYEGDRKYELLYWKREGMERLFLRAEDEKDGLCYGVYELGPLLRIMKPRVSADRKGNIEIFHQSRPAMYLKTRFKSTYGGLVFIDQSSHREAVDEFKQETEEEKE